MSSLRDFPYTVCVLICICALLTDVVTGQKTGSKPKSGKSVPAQKSSGALNRYCTYSVYDPNDPKYYLIDIICKNDPDSPLKENVYNSDSQNTYFQADNGAMSRAVEDAIQQMRTKFPRVTRQIRINVDGYHPKSSTRFYGRLVAMIDISNKLAAGLGGDDYVQLTIAQAGLRVDPRFSARLVKVFPRDGVVLVNWNYTKRSNTRP